MRRIWGEELYAEERFKRGGVRGGGKNRLAVEPRFTQYPTIQKKDAGESGNRRPKTQASKRGGDEKGGEFVPSSMWEKRKHEIDSRKSETNDLWEGRI